MLWEGEHLCPMESSRLMFRLLTNPYKPYLVVACDSVIDHYNKLKRNVFFVQFGYVEAEGFIEEWNTSVLLDARFPFTLLLSLMQGVHFHIIICQERI